jgi:hypothetical protein
MLKVMQNHLIAQVDGAVIEAIGADRHQQQITRLQVFFLL